MKKYILAASIAALALTASCSGKKSEKVAKSESLSNLPAWVIDPSVSDGVGGVGIAPKSKGGIKFQLPQAELEAKANIAATIQSSISRVTKDAMESAKVNDSDDVQNYFSQATKEVVKDLPLSGIKRLHIFQAEDGTLYVHMVLKNEDYTKFLQNSQKAFDASLAKSNIGRENISKTKEATKDLFEELEKERDKKKEEASAAKN